PHRSREVRRRRRGLDESHHHSHADRRVEELQLRRSQRGSVAVFAMIMVVSTAVFVVVMISLSGAQRTKQTRLETNRVVKNAFDGTQTANSPSISFPQPNPSDYQSAAAVQFPSDTDLNGYTFPAGTVSGYPIVYVDGNLTINGTLTGNGVIFVKGTVTITHDVS